MGLTVPEKIVDYLRERRGFAFCDDWLEFASRCGYLSEETRRQLVVKYEELGRMIGKMMESPERFVPS